jgi:hypothetical protein
MNPEASAERRPWSVMRWCTCIALLFGLQLALIFGLSDRSPPAGPAPAPIPLLRLAGESWAPFLALTDPTWFALPHPQGFSGLAWMKVSKPGETNSDQLDPVDFHGFNYTNSPECAPEWLRLSHEQPGLTFAEFVRTNVFGPARLPASPELALTLPELVPLPLSRERSELHVEGELARRTLLSRFVLESKPSSVLLTNSVVQVVVDAAGWPQRAALLKGSGSAQADQEALEKTAVARFTPLAGDGSNQGDSSKPALTPGLLVFEWHTVPDSSTSAATPAP